MLVDLCLQGKDVLVVGGGSVAQKRVRSLLLEGCRITVIAPKTGPYISRLARQKKIKLVKTAIKGTGFLKAGFHLVMACTDDHMLNQQILEAARRRRILSYSSDDPQHSDFANLAVIDIRDVRIGISTGGLSPAISKRLKERSEKVLRGVVTRHDIAQIRLQKTARDAAKEVLPDHHARCEYLKHILNDARIDQLIKDGKLKHAEKQAITILKSWK